MHCGLPSRVRGHSNPLVLVSRNSQCRSELESEWWMMDRLHVRRSASASAAKRTARQTFERPLPGLLPSTGVSVEPTIHTGLLPPLCFAIVNGLILEFYGGTQSSATRGLERSSATVAHLAWGTFTVQLPASFCHPHIVVSPSQLHLAVS